MMFFYIKREIAVSETIVCADSNFSEWYFG